MLYNNKYTVDMSLGFLMSCFLLLGILLKQYALLDDG